LTVKLLSHPFKADKKAVKLGQEIEKKDTLFGLQVQMLGIYGGWPGDVEAAAKLFDGTIKKGGAYLSTATGTANEPKRLIVSRAPLPRCQPGCGYFIHC